MKIYRVENKEGSGPFAAGSYFLNAAKKHKAPFEWPNFKEACKFLDSPTSKFGFDNENALYEVFGDDFAFLAENEFYLSVYEAEPLVSGPDGQVIFDIKEATLAERTKI